MVVPVKWHTCNLNHALALKLGHNLVTSSNNVLIRVCDTGSYQLKFELVLFVIFSDNCLFG